MIIRVSGETNGVTFTLIGLDTQVNMIINYIKLLTPKGMVEISQVMSKVGERIEQTS